MTRVRRKATLQLTRRQALASTTFGLAGAWTTIGKTAASRNDVIRIGIVGMRYGKTLARVFDDLPEADVVALCDVDQKMLSAKWLAQHRQPERRFLKRPEMKTFTDMRGLFDDKQVDAVVIATPNHWHALAAIWAMQAGKDVYVETPCSHNLREGRRLVQAARKCRRVCQHGTQARASDTVAEAIDFLHRGGIGEISMAAAMCSKPREALPAEPDAPPPAELDWNLWQGPAQERPFSRRYVHYNWHWFWDYGNGEIGNAACHQLDLARRGLGRDTHPRKVQAAGGRYGVEDDGQTPNTLTVTYDYGDAVLRFESRGRIAKDERGIRIGNVWYGSEGYLVLNWIGAAWASFMGPKGTPGESGRGNTGNRTGTKCFVTAVRARDASMSCAPIEEGHLSSALSHLGNIAYRTGRTLTFDPQSETFPGDEEANRLLTREYRAPFIVPETV